METNPALCASFQAFSLEMRKVFDHPVNGIEAVNQLLSVKQGNGSVSDFTISFRNLVAETGWENF